MSSPYYSRRRFLGATAASLTLSPGAEGLKSLSDLKPTTSSRLPRLCVHSGGHYLQTDVGKPFFWLGDTAWQLIHSTTREECSYYLQTRADQGYTVIQTVVLSEMDGIRRLSALGLRPFLNDDPRQPLTEYFDRVIEIVDEAARCGLYVALLPTWGDKLTAPWGAGPRVFRSDDLETVRNYGRYLADRLRDRTNVVWMLGGDRPARIRGAQSAYLQETARKYEIEEDADWTPVWTAFADVITKATLGKALILYHPQGGAESTSVLLREAKWLSVNGIQSGHGAGRDAPTWEMIGRDYSVTPAKPTLDLEPNYEDHPYNPWPTWDPATGYFRDYDVRKQLYRSVFAGACGVTYGHHAVWQFANLRNGVINHADCDWTNGMHRPGGRQAVLLRRLIESRPFPTRIPDQSVVVESGTNRADHAQATRDSDGSYLLVYIPRSNQSVTLNLSSLHPGKKTAWWYDPRTGVGTLIERSFSEAQTEVTSPPYGPDWVLVIDSADAHYAPPGLSPKDNARRPSLAQKV